MSSFTEPTRHASGLYVVDWSANFVHWLAWRQWLHQAFDKRFFPQKLTTLFANPPTTAEGAIAVAEWIKGFREQLSKEPGLHTGTLKAVPMAVYPWEGWSRDLVTDVTRVELRRREDWGDTFDHVPQYPWNPRLGLRWPAPVHHSILLPRMHPLRDSLRTKREKLPPLPSCAESVDAAGELSPERRNELRTLRENLLTRGRALTA